MAPKVLLYIYFMILIYFAFGLEFVDEELTLEALEGNNVNIFCKYRDVQAGLAVHWTVPGVKGRTLQSTSNNLDHRFTISNEIQNPRGDTSLVSGTSVFTVTGITVSDDGIYKCELLDINNNVLGSTETDVSVIQFDPVTKSACWIEPSSIVLLGEVRNFRCATKDNSAQLTWMLERTNLEGLQTSSGGVVFLSQSIFVKPLDDDPIFSCINLETNDVLCTTTPLVLHAPIVTIVSDGDIYYGSTARYNCIGNGRPSEYTYHWWYDDFPIRENTHHRFNRVRLDNNNSTLILTDLSEQDDKGSGIMCKVTNSIGTGTGTLIVEGLVPKSTGEKIGPFLVAFMCIIIIVVLLAFFCWWKRQKRMVRKISRRRKKVKSTKLDSELPSMTDYMGASGSFVACSVMDLEAIGYGPDTKPGTHVEPNDRDSGVGDDGIRPIPRRTIVSTSIGKPNLGYQDDSQDEDDVDFDTANDSVDPEEKKMKSYSYEVNPNFNSNRKSKTFDIVEIPNFDTEEESTDEDSDFDIKMSKISDGQSGKGYSSDAEDQDKESTSGFNESTSL